MQSCLYTCLWGLCKWRRYLKPCNFQAWVCTCLGSFLTAGPKATTPSLSPPPRMRTMIFGRDGCDWAHFITHYGWNPWRCLHLCLCESFTADSRRNVSHSVTTILLSQPPTLTWLFPRHAVLLSTCQPHPPPRPFHVPLSSFTVHYAALHTACGGGITHTHMHFFLSDSSTQVRCFFDMTGAIWT